MKRPFAAIVYREGNWHVSWCLEIDFVRWGETHENTSKLESGYGTAVSNPAALCSRNFLLSH